MPINKSPANVNKENIESLVEQLNHTSWFRQEFSCIDFVAAVWYHYYKEQIFTSQEKVHKAYKAIDHASRYFLYSAIYEDEVMRDQIDKLPNLTILLQASHKRAMPLHASILFVDQQGERHILEKDGNEPAHLIPLSQWKTYEEDYPTYAAHTFRETKIVFRAALLSMLRQPQA
jgi:hypothetical protein